MNGLYVTECILTWTNAVYVMQITWTKLTFVPNINQIVARSMKTLDFIIRNCRKFSKIKLL